MTTQTVHIQTYDYGASLTSATLRAIDTDTLVATADTTNEVTVDSGLYAAVFGEVAAITAGTYRLRAIAGGQPINRYVTLVGVDAEVVQSRLERFAELPPNSITASVLATDAVSEIQSGLATPTNITAATGITVATNNDKTGYSLTQGFPANFSAFGINASGHVERVVLVDTTTANTDMRGTDSAVLASNYMAPPTTGAIADAVLTESILDHRTVAHSLAKFVWQIRQANLTIEGIVSNAITPTTLTFASDVVATTSAYAHAVLLFTTGPLAGENSPIISYNSTNGVFLLEEALTAAPSDGDEFVVIAGSHVHSVAAIQDGLARTGADGDTLETLSDQIDGIGGGGGGSGGDATLAKQEEIIAVIQGSKVIQVASPNVLGNLVLTQGDSYDGIANPKAQWTVTTDYTDGWAVTLTIRDEDDAVIYTTAGTVVSSTIIAVAIAAPTGLTMAGCPGQWQGKFDVELTKAGSKKTIALGTCYINEDQTR